MWLTGNEIIKQHRAERITITDFDEKAVNANSYNYHLGRTILRLEERELDARKPARFSEHSIPDDGFVLMPGECYLGRTQEVFGSNFYASLVTGRSSVGRMFVTNHITAGLIDQGFLGSITLEITAQRPTRVYAGMPFGQIFWFAVEGEARLYSGKYQGQMAPTPSRLHLDP